MHLFGFKIDFLIIFCTCRPTSCSISFWPFVLKLQTCTPTLSYYFSLLDELSLKKEVGWPNNYYIQFSTIILMASYLKPGWCLLNLHFSFMWIFWWCIETLSSQKQLNRLHEYFPLSVKIRPKWMSFGSSNHSSCLLMTVIETALA